MGEPSLKILFVSAEVAPFVRTGGLADVCNELPRALTDLGHDVRLITPWYRKIAQQGVKTELIRDSVPLDEAGLPQDMPQTFSLRQGVLPDSSIPVYFVDQPSYFDREGLYGDEQGDHLDNGDRFTFLALSVFAACKALDFKPDVLHINDWHGGLVPVYLKNKFRQDPFFEKTGTLCTIHNLAYQGLFPDWQFGRTALDAELFNAQGLEFYGQMNTLKGAVLFSDKINTLSPRYAEEIRNPEYGCGLEGVLRTREADLSGIVSGLNTDAWNPSADSYLPLSYGPETLHHKAEIKRALKAELGLPEDDVPLVAMVSRLDPMKGLSLIEEITDYLMHLDLQFVLLGTGDARIEESFLRLAEIYPEKAAVRLAYDVSLAHRIAGGADVSLMPSRFEPSGQNQLISLRYGTIPVVRSVGGLADTVQDYDARSGKGNGFAFSEYNSMALFNAIQRALETYKDRDAWGRLQRQGMAEDHSWAASARHYEKLYREIALLRA